MFELILQNIAKHISLDEAETIYFTSVLAPLSPVKKEIILAEGQLCKTIYFVNTGTLRAFFTDTQGRESTIMFASKGWWITDMHCFLNQLPAMLQIEAIENSSLLQLQKADLDKLYERIPKFERFIRIIMQNAYTREQLRMIETLSLSAEERYHRFLSKYPQVANQVTQKQIASYLGITPEFLSMIRAKMAGK